MGMKILPFPFTHPEVSKGLLIYSAAGDCSHLNSTGDCSHLNSTGDCSHLNSTGACQKSAINISIVAPTFTTASSKCNFPRILYKANKITNVWILLDKSHLTFRRNSTKLDQILQM